MRARRGQRGFTLIEMVMVIVIMGVISVVVGRILASAYQTFYTSQNISDVDWKELLVMETFTNDIHSIRSKSDILTISPTNFSFINMSGTTVTYQLSGSTLTRNSLTLATGVNSIAFSYHDQNYAVTAIPANVRYVTVSISVTQNNLTLSLTTMAGTRGLS